MTIRECAKYNSTMRPIPLQCVRLVQNEEGCVLHPYRDAAGRWTIFTGHLIKATEHFVAPYTQEQADTVLRNDMADAAHMVEAFCKMPLNDNEFSALVSFVFNEGAGTFHDSGLLRYINGGGTDQYQVTVEFGRFVYTHRNGQLVVLQDLVRRRQHEADLYNTAVTIA